ncbi:MAG: YkgJ family cysteine cluster protein [Deltaproteobacteria bacterium]|nr:YkgJ family cysteine cluster protein [Deltaproteobacteria bacterium]
MSEINPCLSCGACCAYYRASFYWAEADDATPGGVPSHMTEKLNDFRRVMIGTNQNKPRCIALAGEIGNAVFCSIYENRSSVCRDFEPSWSGGRPNERCDNARIAWGLSPLEPNIDNAPDNLPRAA